MAWGLALSLHAALVLTALYEDTLSRRPTKVLEENIPVEVIREPAESPVKEQNAKPADKPADKPAVGLAALPAEPPADKSVSKPEKAPETHPDETQSATPEAQSSGPPQTPNAASALSPQGQTGPGSPGESREGLPPPSGPLEVRKAPRNAATSAYPMAPPSFQAAAAPAASEKDNEEYKAVVFGVLESAKRYPADAQARRASGAAVIAFMLDSAGNLVTRKLLASTGDAGLDAEALDLVRRVSPFPRPPEGANLNFTPLIRFGLD